MASIYSTYLVQDFMKSVEAKFENEGHSRSMVLLYMKDQWENIWLEELPNEAWGIYTLWLQYRFGGSRDVKMIKKLLLVHRLISNLNIMRSGEKLNSQMLTSTKKNISKIQSQLKCPICNLVYKLIKKGGLNAVTSKNVIERIQAMA